MTHQYSKANPLLLFTDIATNLNRAKFKCKATQRATPKNKKPAAVQRALVS
jgi:hypothetical protein